MGQCLTAVGWVAGTVPSFENHPNIIELPMADVAGGGIAVGAALDETRPVIYIVRYQGFLWYNAISIANYAAKSFELFGVPCPLIVRAIGMEGGIGPVAGNYHLSILLRMPGINVFAPMTTSEWNFAISKHFEENTHPTILGEHRSAYNIDFSLDDRLIERSEMNILALGSSRINSKFAQELLAKKGIRVNLFNLFKLAPLEWPMGLLEAIKETNNCLIVDSDYEEWGPSQTIAFKLSKLTGGNIDVLGLTRKSAGFSPTTDNLTPSVSQIVDKVQNLIQYT
jgi:pyruvate/2-oxoglutarate/acetoin dehydrogenase E1 component